MTMMSDLSHDVVEEILSRVQRSSLRAVRSTCKLWNRLSRNRILCNVEAREEFLGFTMMHRKLYSIRLNLNEDGEEIVDASIKPIGNILDQIEISKVFYCDGLLLCVRKESGKLVVWNPYLGQTRWIQPRIDLRRRPKYALGYDKNKNHKILRFFDRGGLYEVYDFKSMSWSLMNVIPNWAILSCYERGASLHGNTYFMCCERIGKDLCHFILCFDFTTERFGQVLPIPFKPTPADLWSVSSAREEKLAALVQYSQMRYVIDIWVTIKVEPNAVSWSKFLRVDMGPLVGFGFEFDVNKDSFFIDEEKKVVTVFSYADFQTSKAYIIGDNRCLKTVDLEKVAYSQLESLEFRRYNCCYSSYYVPSLVQINQIT